MHTSVYLLTFFSAPIIRSRADRETPDALASSQVVVVCIFRTIAIMPLGLLIAQKSLIQAFEAEFQAALTSVMEMV